MNSGWTETAAQLLTDRSMSLHYGEELRYFRTDDSRTTRNLDELEVRQGFNEAKKRLSKPMDGLRDDNRDLRLLVYKQEEQIKDLQRQIQELQS